MNNTSKTKLIRITTVPISLEKLLGGQLAYMNQCFQVIAVSSEKEKLEKVGKDQQVSTFYVELNRQITIVKDIKASLK